MTDVTTSQDHEPAELSAADEQLLHELTERARAGGLQLTGEGGLLGKLTKMVVEGALEGELDDHLGYPRHDPAGRDSGNSRNGHRAKTVLSEAGPVEISVPRDRDSSFERAYGSLWSGFVVFLEAPGFGLIPRRYSACPCRPAFTAGPKMRA